MHVRGGSVPPSGVPHTSGAGRVASACLASTSDRKPCFPLQEHSSSTRGKGSGCLGYVRYLMGTTEWDGDLASVPSCQPQILSYVFYPLLSQLADREVRQRIELLPGTWLELAILLVD